MRIKLKIKRIKKSKENKIIIWVQKHKDFVNEMQQILNFFKDQIKYTIKSRFFQYYKITSENPAIMLSILTTIQELIPEIYFNTSEAIDLENISSI
ncbi:MAG: hypothetical protein ACFFD5_04880 [Candidatus Thorarchaeota archaeon]